MKTNEQIVRDFIAAWSRLDVDEIIAYFAPDGTYYNMMNKPVSGHDNLQHFIGGFVKDWTQTTWDILNIVARGKIVMAERLDRTQVGGKRGDARDLRQPAGRAQHRSRYNFGLSCRREHGPGVWCRQLRAQRLAAGGDEPLRRHRRSSPMARGPIRPQPDDGLRKCGVCRGRDRRAADVPAAGRSGAGIGFAHVPQPGASSPAGFRRRLSKRFPVRRASGGPLEGSRQAG